MTLNNERTYASQIAELDRQITMLQAQIEAQEQVVATNKAPISLFASMMSPHYRRTALSESYRSRRMIADLNYRLSQAQTQRQALVRLQEQFPSHDALIERTNRYRRDEAYISLEEDEVELEERRKQLDRKRNKLNRRKRQ